MAVVTIRWGASRREKAQRAILESVPVANETRRVLKGLQVVGTTPRRSLRCQFLDQHDWVSYLYPFVQVIDMEAAETEWTQAEARICSRCHEIEAR